MAGSITDFKASFRTDLARPNRFDVNIPIPIGLLPYRGIGRTLGLFFSELGQISSIDLRKKQASHVSLGFPARQNEMLIKFFDKGQQYVDDELSKKQPNQRKESDSEDWLVNGLIDKPAYFVVKITNKDYFDSKPDCKFLKQEGGFLFYKRSPAKH
jgi:hypothetical protein